MESLYSCISSFVLLIMYISSSRCERIVDKPPKIITEPEKSWNCEECEMGERVILYFKEGERAELTCIAYGRPEPEYEWRKDGQVINFDNPVYISKKTNKTRVVQQGGVGTLEFLETLESDVGIYQCFAKNHLGTALSLKVDLKQAINMPFPTLSKPDIVQKLYGHPLILACQPPLSIPKARVFWTEDSENSEDFTRIEQSRRVIMDYNGNLYFTNLEKSDERNSKPYVCNTFHKTFRSYNKGADKIIKGIGADSEKVIMLMPSILWTSTTTVLGLKGEEAKFMCIFAGKPTPNITWSRIGGKLDSTRMVVSEFGHELKISDIDGSDEGQYQCVGKNRLASASVTFTLRVDSKPHWVNTPTDQEVGVDESTSFQCLAEGKPKPSVQWFINGIPIAVVKLDKVRIQLRNNQLSYSKLKTRDTSVIQCLANNTHGSLWADFYLNVLALVPEITSEPGKKKVAEGQAVTLRCENNGKPNPTLEWWRATDTPQILNGPRYSSVGDALTIQDVTTDDEGLYECKAKNRLGEDIGIGQLTVRKATKIVGKPTGGQVMYGRPFTFQCTAKTDNREKSKLTIHWLRDGIRVDPKTDPNVVTTSNQLKILKTSSRYSGNYTCVARNGIDEARATDELRVEAPPDPPRLNLLDCGAKSARLRWSGAHSNFRPIKKYIIEKKMFFEFETEWESMIETAGDVSEIKLSLSPYVNYTFQIKAENDLGEGEPSDRTTTCLTDESIPDDNPRHVRIIEDTTNYLIIEWEQMPPEQHNAPKFHYLVIVRKVGDSKKQEYIIDDYRETRKEIQTNDTYQQYEVHVKAVNSKGDALSPPLTNKGHSGMAPPLVVPKNFEVDPNFNMTYEVAGFRWDKVDTSPEKIRGKFEGYKIRYWRPSDPDRKKEVIVRSDAQSELRRRREAEDKVKAVVEHLPAYTSLQLDVVVTNTYFSSNGSEVLNLSTPEGVPGPVRNLRAESRGVVHLKISWREPQHPNGKIRGYDVFYEEIRGLDFSDRVYSKGVHELYGGRYVTVINGLKEKTNYRVHVIARTDPGLGEDFYIDVVTASPGDPAVPIIKDIKTTYNSLNVSWSLDRNHERAAFQHYVEYRKQGNSDYTKMPPETLLNWQVVPNLTSGEVYEVRVVAQSGSGYKRSSPRSIATLGQVAQVATAVYEHTWFIIMMISLAILILIVIIVCFVKRSRGDKYHVQEKEKLRGLDPDEKKSAHINEFNDNGEKQPLAGGSDPDLEKAGLDSEQDSLEEYGDVDPSRFNEDGSFIGQYGGQNTIDTNQPSAMHTFV